MLSCHAARSARVLPVAILAAALGIAGCSGGEPAPGASLAPGLGCVDDSWECINKRQAALKSIMADGSRSWVRQPATPSAYASGVRLFAFRGKKKELGCDELGIGRREADAAPQTLRGPGGSGLTPAQVSRSIMLAAEVSKELGNEYNRRCKKA